MPDRLPSRPLDDYDNDLALIVSDDEFMRDLHTLMDDRRSHTERHYVAMSMQRHVHHFVVRDESCFPPVMICECGSSDR